MKGVILAGGTGSRLGVLTRVVNKHLLHVYNKPMIFYPITTIRSLGIKSVMIVTDKRRAGDFLNLLGTGSEFGLRFSYGLQDGAFGIADAIRAARDFASNDEITVILGDNIFFGDFLTTSRDKKNAKIFLSSVKDPERFGIAKISESGELVDLVEKPIRAASSLAITGLYQYPEDVFDIIETIEPSMRGELEVTELNKYYLRKSRLEYQVISNDWIDAGTVDSLFQAQQMAKKHYNLNSSKDE